MKVYKLFAVVTQHDLSATKNMQQQHTSCVYMLTPPVLKNKRVLYILKWKGRPWGGGGEHIYIYVYIYMYIYIYVYIYIYFCSRPEFMNCKLFGTAILVANKKCRLFWPDSGSEYVQDWNDSSSLQGELRCLNVSCTGWAALRGGRGTDSLQ